MAVSTINRCCTGRAVRMASYSAGVRVRAFFLTTLGSSVWAQGLKGDHAVALGAFEDRSQHGVVLAHAGGREAVLGGGGDPALDLGGQDLAHGPGPEGGDEVLVEVGAVGGQGGGLDVLGGQPDGLDVLGEGDLATGVVVPGAVADPGFFAVGGAFCGAARGVGAGGALSAFGVASCAWPRASSGDSRRSRDWRRPVET